MAINTVEQRQGHNRVIETKGRKGGGALGGKIGAVIGGVAGAVAGSGWGSVAGATAGASGGMAVGNTIGEAIKPTKQGSTAMERRLSAGAPQPLTGSEKLKDSILALHQAPIEVRQEYAQPLVSAYLDMLAKERTGVA